MDLGDQIGWFELGVDFVVECCQINVQVEMIGEIVDGFLVFVDFSGVEIWFLKLVCQQVFFLECVGFGKKLKDRVFVEEVEVDGEEVVVFEIMFFCWVG